MIKYISGFIIGAWLMYICLSWPGIIVTIIVTIILSILLVIGYFIDLALEYKNMANNAFYTAKKVLGRLGQNRKIF